MNIEVVWHIIDISEQWINEHRSDTVWLLKDNIYTILYAA